MLHSIAINKDCQGVSSRPIPTSHLPSTASHGTRTAKLLVSLGAVLLVVASAGFGCVFAWRLGAQQAHRDCRAQRRHGART
jgi:hypothetical protein